MPLISISADSSEYRNRQPLRRRFVQYQERGRGKQEQSGRTALEIRNSKFEIRNESQARKPNDRNAVAGRDLLL